MSRLAVIDPPNTQWCSPYLVRLNLPDGVKYNGKLLIEYAIIFLGESVDYRTYGYMKIQLKKVLRFYFSAGSLNAALDGVIFRLASSSWREMCGGGRTFDRLNYVIEIKSELEDFWARLDNVMSKLPAQDLSALKTFASLRTGVSSLEVACRRRIHSALVKFSRRAGVVLSSSKRGYECVCAYYALISPVPD